MTFTVCGEGVPKMEMKGFYSVNQLQNGNKGEGVLKKPEKIAVLQTYEDVIHTYM